MVIEQIIQTPQRIRTDGQIEDFCDGTVFSSHPLFSKDPYALQIIAYYDELELCNPLGSHIKQHKVGIVFYMLGNIAPKYRSQLKLINLAIIASVPLIESYGLDKVLEPFIVDLNILATTGISINIDGLHKNFKGALLAFLADNLASNDLGGFKKSFSFSFRCCRTCLVTHDTLSSIFISDGYERRSMDTHLQHISLLDGPTGSHYSKTYGINRRSALLDIAYFNMLESGLPHDAMHDILEGIAPLEIKLMLSYYVKNDFVSLEEYNSRLLRFNFGYSDNDKPVPILCSTLHSPDRSLRSTASQMLLLVRILPFLIADTIPEGEEHWLCFLLLRKIIDIVLCPVVSENLCTSVKLLIREHHSKFVALYGAAHYIPKMHFILHYPEQMKALGPMVRTWTIRQEAKLNFFKQASRLANFKNVSFSLASRHQRWMCYELASQSILYTPLECGPAKSGCGITFVKDETNDIQDHLLSIFPQLSKECTLFRPTWVRINGILYQNNNAYLITSYDGLDPVFGYLNDLMVIGGDKVIFMVLMCCVLYFDSHYHSYVVSVGSQKLLISDILDHNVYHGHTLSDGLTYIPLKYIIT